MTADIFLTSRFGPAHSVDLAKVAERAGLGGVWLAEHYFTDYGKCPSATMLAYGILNATKRIRVGTAACVMSERDPVRLGLEAEMAYATGRFDLGVARGGQVDGFPWWLDSLREHYRGPIWVAATSMSTVEVAARRGMPLLLGVENDDLSAKEKTDHWASIAGLSSSEHARVVLANPDGEDLRERLAQWLAGKANRDWSSHIEHLMRTPPNGNIYMVEAAGSVEATAKLIERLGSMC